MSDGNIEVIYCAATELVKAKEKIKQLEAENEKLKQKIDCKTCKHYERRTERYLNPCTNCKHQWVLNDRYEKC